MKKSVFLGLVILTVVFSTKGQIISTYAGNGIGGYSGDNGLATSAQIDLPFGIAIDGSGNLFFADFNNHRIRKISAGGIITTVAGSGTSGFSGDGGAATSAKLDNPIDVAVDAAGNLYIADRDNNRIRKVNTSGIITTVAGGGSNSPTLGGSATSADVFMPRGVAVDASGNFYLTTLDWVCKVNTSGIISVIAGGGSNSPTDGLLATTVSFNVPKDLALDGSGNIYIANENGKRIHKVNTSGILTNIAGTGTAGFNGDGGQATLAQLNYPYGITLDALGNLYIADSFNNRVRKVNTSGVITTIAGGGGSLGDGGLATNGKLNNPNGVAVDATGNVFVTDGGYDRIRMICANCGTQTSVPDNYLKNNTIVVYPNPVINQLNFSIHTNVQLTNLAGQIIIDNGNVNTLDLSELPSGVYFGKFTDNNGFVIQRSKIIKE